MLEVTALWSQHALADITHVIVTLTMLGVGWRARRQNEAARRFTAYGGSALCFIGWRTLQDLQADDVMSSVCGLLALWSILWNAVDFCQFAYAFPQPLPAEQAERRLVQRLARGLLGAGALIAGSGCYAILRLQRNSEGDELLLLGSAASVYAVTVGVLLRRVWRAPHAPEAQASRALAGTLCAPLFMLSVGILEHSGYVSAEISSSAVSVGMIGFLFALTNVYLTYAQITSSFLVKLVGVTLITMLAVVGVIGFTIGGRAQRRYTNASHLLAQHTLRLHPRADGGYTLTKVAAQFDPELGAPVTTADALPIGFPFRYFHQTWTHLRPAREGILYFITSAAPPRPNDCSINWFWQQPAIIPWLMDFAPTTGQLWYKPTPTAVVLTWQQMTDRWRRTALTFQVRLFQDGQIEVTYAALRGVMQYDVSDDMQALVGIGFTPGGPTAPVALPPWETLDTEDIGQRGAWHNYYRDFRAALHADLALLVWQIVGASLVLIIGLPFFFRRLLIRPIYALRDGVQRVNAGHLALSVPVIYHDEIGFLTQAFNAMVTRIADYSQNLEQNVAARTHELSQALRDLQNTQQELIKTEKMAALGKLIANIAHEINTPLGAIRASTASIANALDETTRDLPPLLRTLPAEQYEPFLALLARASQPKPAITSREERAHRRAVERELDAAGVANADAIADTFVDMGIYDDITPALPLLRSGQVASMLQAAYHLASQHHHSANILAAVERMAKIVFALKSYAHADASGETMLASVTDGLDVVLTLYYNQLKHGIEVVKQYEDVPEIRCDPDELNQVWTNLIHNAIQAMQGKGRLEISVLQQQPTPTPSQEGNSLVESSTSVPLLGGGRGGSSVVIAITDSGPGIPDEIKSRIFEPFFTTKPAGEGSGMGLDICKKILDKHQGRIEFESQPGRTTFRVWLPLKEMANSASS